MRVDVIPIEELSDDLKQRWLVIQASNPSLAGPCFCPELFVTAGNAMPHIYVALIYEGKEILGFLPFRKDQNQPIAWPIEFCYYEAIIGPPRKRWDIDKILKQSDLKTWEFRALADFKRIKPKKGEFTAIEAARIDLTDGFEKYQEAIKYKQISYKNLMYKQSLLKRDIGPIRFVPFCNDVSVLHRLLDKKTLQFNRDPSWAKSAREFSERFFYLKNDPFSGILSTLYAGDEVIAAIFNLRYQGIMQFFITSYDEKFKKYSPGLLLLHYLIRQLSDFQCKILDFGLGDQKYKWESANSTFPIMTGRFEVDSFKERIKSVKWLYHGLHPLVQAERKILAKLKIRGNQKINNN